MEKIAYDLSLKRKEKKKDKIKWKKGGRIKREISAPLQILKRKRLFFIGITFFTDA